MKILSISNMGIWMWGEGKGIPSKYFIQKEFANRGHDVYFICPLREFEPRYSFKDGIHIDRFDFPFNFKKNIYFQADSIFSKFKGRIWHNFNWLFFQIFGFLYGIKLGLKVRPDIVYAHSTASVLPAYLVSRLLSLRFIIRLYGVGTLYREKNSLRYRIRNFRDCLVFKIPADYFIITNDGGYGNIVAKDYGVKAEKIRYWRNGIDKDMYEEDPNAREEICKYYNINPSSYIIASTSRLIPIYGVDKLIYSIIELLKRQPNCVCLIAGDGTERSRLQKIIKDTGISANVVFTGIVDRKMIKKILNSADIFVLLSKFHNCTNTMWEAMACGKCIVTTDTTAIREILVPDEDAVLVPWEQLNKLPDILSNLLQNERLRKKFGVNAKKKALQFLEPWSKRAEKEAILLEGLIKE